MSPIETEPATDAAADWFAEQLMASPRATMVTIVRPPVASTERESPAPKRRRVLDVGGGQLSPMPTATAPATAALWVAD